MPRRPAKQWMAACTTAVAKSPTSIDPGAICGATWKRKSPAEKASIVREERSGRRRPHRLTGQRYEVRGRGRGGRPAVLAMHKTKKKATTTARSFAKRYPGQRFGVFDRQTRRYVGFSIHRGTPSNRLGHAIPRSSLDRYRIYVAGDERSRGMLLAASNVHAVYLASKKFHVSEDKVLAVRKTEMK